MWKKSSDPYFNCEDLINFHLSTFHNRSNLSGNRINTNAIFPPKGSMDVNGISIDNDESLDFDKKIEDLFNKRRTSWEFNQRMTVETLNCILKNALGVTAVDPVKKRAYPSAGCLFSVNIYVYLRNFNDTRLDDKVFKYNPESKQLLEVNALSIKEINKICSSTMLTQKSFENANCVFFFTSDLVTLFQKYGKLAYRLSFLEAGHICENIQLLGCHFDLSCVPIGGFYDEYVQEIIKNDTEYCLYILGMG
ncbi:SagB/ThcOx family dehydrogenase [Lysinibacillus xylanilyticus]|uniref:SagB/ThcOx family dehydrogenase n=1 Tax=Lysinibacillus xylanilyticus TaxID=582475 RepID=UPI0038156209